MELVSSKAYEKNVLSKIILKDIITMHCYPHIYTYQLLLHLILSMGMRCFTQSDILFIEHRKRNNQIVVSSWQMLTNLYFYTDTYKQRH